MKKNWDINRPYRLDMELQVEQEAVGCGDLIPAALDGFKLNIIENKAVAPDSMVLVRYDDKGQPIVFDHQKKGEEALKITFRFDPDYQGSALPFAAEKGALVFPAPFQPRKQFYSIYFDTCAPDKAAGEYMGLIGDGDIFTQKKGNLSVPAMSHPALYGEKLFGKKGMVVGSSYRMGIYFFEEIDTNGRCPGFINRGRLKDSRGNIIWGIPAIHDVNKDGLLDLVVGRNDGTLCWHKNTGSNERPVFAGPESLRETDGHPLDLKKYLGDKEIIFQLADGTINKRYPRAPVILTHGGETHIYTVPQFVDWSGQGRDDLLIGAAGFLLHFEHTESGYKKGKFLKDEKGEILRCEPISAFPAVCDWDGDGRLDILVGSFHGFVYYLQNAGMKDGAPVFRNKGKLKIDKESGCSFPLAAAESGHNLGLFVGNSHGEIKHYARVGTTETGEPVLGNGEYIQAYNAWVSRDMPVAQYTDMDGDGRNDLLSGDIRGGMFLYKNLGTTKNPIFTSACHLRDENGPIKIEGGPDPIEVNDGYSKPVAADISGDGRPDILVGTGFGKIIFYRNLGLDKEGIPCFEKGKALNDAEGNEIRCHHMSAVGFGDWDGDGVPDLIVSGQKNVHAMEDDDPDPETQVRWYRGIRKGKRLEFMPYIPLEAEGDKEFCYRPIPPLIDEWEGKKALYTGNIIYRPAAGKGHPERVEYVRWLPPRLARDRESIITAYFTISSLGENDPLIVQGSCVGSVFAFRKTFVLNRGYLRAAGRLTSARSADGGLEVAINLPVSQPSPAISCPGKVIVKEYKIPFVAGGPEGGNSIDEKYWSKIPVYHDFKDSQGNKIPAGQDLSAAIAYDKNDLSMLIKVNEPLMARLLTTVQHDNGPIEGEDHVMLAVDPGVNSELYYGWWINAAGFKKEINIELRSGETVGPWRCGGKEQVKIKAWQTDSSYAIQVQIPFIKLGAIPRQNDCWLIDIRRYRALYANEIRATEQRLCNNYSWSGGNNGWIKLLF